MAKGYVYISGDSYGTVAVLDVKPGRGTISYNIGSFLQLLDCYFERYP